MNPKHVKLIVKYDRDYNEWQVRVYKDGKFSENDTYFGGGDFREDQDDAIETAREMARFYRAGGSVVEFGGAAKLLAQENPAKSKAQFRWAHAAYRSGRLTRKQLRKIIEGSNYRKLPERVGNKRKRTKKMAKKRHKKLTKAQRRRIALRNLAKARRSLGRRSTRRMKKSRRVIYRRNLEIGDMPPAAYIREWYRVDGVKKKISTLEAAALRGKGYKVEKAAAPVKRGPRRKKRKSSKASRKTARRRSKAALRRLRMRSLQKARAALRAKRRGTRRVARKPRTRRHRSAKAIRRERLRNLRKARAALRRKSRKGRKSRRHFSRGSVVSRAIRRVAKKRPFYARSAIRRIALRDYRLKRHRRGRNRVKRLALDTKFEMDFRRAFRSQKLSSSRLRRRIRRLGRHPSHLSQRKTTPGTRRGWKEFAGYPPNVVTKFGRSPVKGTFNGVLIDELHGIGANTGRRILIKPPKNAPLWFIWGSGARTFEIVGPSNSITSLAKGMAKANEPIRITRINYLAPTYPAPAGTRRTGRESMSVAYTHAIKNKAYLTWNQKSGTSARFPIITRGTRGMSMVNRSGITL